jgi:hypothetical protein
MARKTELELQTHWRSVLEDFAAGDFKVGQYCQERRMSKASLYSWSRRLGIPLRNRENLTDTDQVRKDNKQGYPAKDEDPFSFIELNISPPPAASSSCPVKLELLLTQGRSLKIEATPSWEGVIGMIKVLVN